MRYIFNVVYISRGSRQIVTKCMFDYANSLRPRVSVMCQRIGSSLPQVISCYLTLRWRHNARDSVSNHQPHDCFLNRLFRRRSKKTPKLRVTGLCVGKSPGTGEFPAQMASNTENVSIWWRHHELNLHKNALIIFISIVPTDGLTKLGSVWLRMKLTTAVANDIQAQIW